MGGKRAAHTRPAAHVSGVFSCLAVSRGGRRYGPASIAVGARVAASSGRRCRCALGGCGGGVLHQCLFSGASRLVGALARPRAGGGAPLVVRRLRASAPRGLVAAGAVGPFAARLRGWVRAWGLGGGPRRARRCACVGPVAGGAAAGPWRGSGGRGLAGPGARWGPGLGWFGARCSWFVLLGRRRRPPYHGSVVPCPACLGGRGRRAPPPPWAFAPFTHLSPRRRVFSSCVPRTGRGRCCALRARPPFAPGGFLVPCAFLAVAGAAPLRPGPPPPVRRPRGPPLSCAAPCGCPPAPVLGLSHHNALPPLPSPPARPPRHRGGLFVPVGPVGAPSGPVFLRAAASCAPPWGRLAVLWAAPPLRSLWRCRASLGFPCCSLSFWRPAPFVALCPSGFWGLFAFSGLLAVASCSFPPVLFVSGLGLFFVVFFFLVPWGVFVLVCVVVGARLFPPAGLTSPLAACKCSGSGSGE